VDKTPVEERFDGGGQIVFRLAGGERSDGENEERVNLHILVSARIGQFGGKRSIRTQKFGSTVTDSGALGSGNWKLWRLVLSSRFSVRSPMEISRGRRYGSPGWVCSRSTVSVCAAGSYFQVLRTWGQPGRRSHWSKNHCRSWPLCSSITRRNPLVLALPL